jgi:hypothetical protein
MYRVFDVRQSPSLRFSDGKGGVMDSIRMWLWNKAQAALDRITHRQYADAYNNWVMFQNCEPCWKVPQFWGEDDKGGIPNPDRWEMQ